MTVPVEVLDRATARARRQLGPAASTAAVVRLGLALVAEVDPDDYPVPLGRPPVLPRPAEAPAA